MQPVYSSHIFPPRPGLDGETLNYERPPVLLLCAVIAAMFLRQLEAPRSPLAPLYYRISR